MAFAIKFILVMFSMILADICWTMYFIEVDKRRPIPAGIWGSSILLLFGPFTTVHYVNDHRLLIAAVLGAFIGTAGTVYYKNKKENK